MFFSFFKGSLLVSIAAAPLYILSNNMQESSLSHSLSSTSMFCWFSFFNGLPGRCELVCSGRGGLQFADDERY